MGKPLIASDVGGHRELVEHGRTGILFAAGDAQALAEAVGRVLEDGALAARLADEGMQFVRTRRSWPGSVRGYADPYRRVLAGVRA
jgi:glycosyltransferase involved in cell wall biosynthesis